MEPIFKLCKTILQHKSHRFNFTCIDCCELIIALGTDIGSCHLYSTVTLRPFGQIIYLPNLPHSNQTENKKQSIITTVSFSAIQHETDFILLLIGTESGHIHLYNIDIINSQSIKVQTIKIEDNKLKTSEQIHSLLWCKLEKLDNNYIVQSTNEAAQAAMIESLKIIVSVRNGKIYLLHLISNYISTMRQDTPVKIINVQLIYECKQNTIIQTSFKTHFVLVSCLTKCFILDFSTIYNMSTLAEHKKAHKSNKYQFHSLPFVNGANMESMKYFINVYQIGSKLRNGYYGACFDCQSIDGCDQILSARKSGRVWVGETQSGSVRNTLRFKLPKIPNIFLFDDNCSGSSADIGWMDTDPIWSKDLKCKPSNEHETEQKSEDMPDMPEFANVSNTVCQQLGVLIPFGNWTLSYLHPKDINNEKNIRLDIDTLSFTKHKTVSKVKKRMGYHEKLNNFGLKILDHNLPKCVQWYPNLGKIIDVAVLESQCCFYTIYKPLTHSVTDQTSQVILGKIELSSPNESVKALIHCHKITIAIDYICAYKVRDMSILENVKKILLKREEETDTDPLTEIVKDLHINTIHKFDVHFEETKQFYDDHNNNIIIMDKPAQETVVNEQKLSENTETDTKDKFVKYRKASMDYEASQKLEQLTDRTLKPQSANDMKWEPAKFDNVLGTVDSPQSAAIDLSQDSNPQKKEDLTDLFSAKKFGNWTKKMVKQISNIGNSPQPPLPAIDLSENVTESKSDEKIAEQTQTMEENESKTEEITADNEFEDTQLDLDNVPELHLKQKQNIALARRKSSANQQIFTEAEVDVSVPKYKDKKKKRKKKTKKKDRKKFAAITAAPKSESSKKIMDKSEMSDANKIIHTAKPGGGSILALDPDIKPHEIIYGDDGMLVGTKPDISEDTETKAETESDTNVTNVKRIHKLLQETAKCDSMLRRRMRNELEEICDKDSSDGLEMETTTTTENKSEMRSFAAVGLSNINYRNSPRLMNKMSYLLGEYEGQINEFNSAYFYKWTNKIGEKLSTVLTRMLCVFISVKIDIGKESEQSVFEILKKFLLILDFEWVLKLCNTHKLYNLLRQLAALQYEQNSASFNRIEIEKAYLMQNYQTLIRLIDKYRSPLLILQYLPLLIEKGYSHVCYTIAVGYFPHISPAFVRKFMYRFAIDNQSKLEKEAFNNIFRAYAKYLKLLFNVHSRTRCNGLFVLDLITLTLSLNTPNTQSLFKAEETVVESDEKKEEKSAEIIDIIPKGYTVPTVYKPAKIPLIHSENKYSDGLTKYILSIMSDKSYMIEWSYLEIVFKEYGFWKGLYKVYQKFHDIQSLILLCVYLDYAPILSVLCDLCHSKYWENLLLCIAYVYKMGNERNNRLNFEIAIRYMMRNIGSKETLKCLNEPCIVQVLHGNINNIIYKEIVTQKENEMKRDKLISKVQSSLSNYLLSQYTLNSFSNYRGSNANEHSKLYNKNEITPEFKKLIDTLSNIQHSSDEWTVMSSVNVRPPTQRAAAPLEKNLTDLFVQFI